MVIGRTIDQERAFHKQAFTLVEVMVSLAIFLMLLGGMYRLFFSRVRSIKMALEHVGVNESARNFLARFGNDVRNANRLLYPLPIARESVLKLSPATEGIVCNFESQVFDFTKKPPDNRFIKKKEVTWRLTKVKNLDFFDLHRDEVSEIPPFSGAPVPFKSTRVICHGVKEMLVFTSLHRPAKLNSFAGLPFKNLLVFEPFNIDGTGPYLVNTRITFVRSVKDNKTAKDQIAHTLRTSFAIRGRPNWVNP